MTKNKIYLLLKIQLLQLFGLRKKRKEEGAKAGRTVALVCLAIFGYICIEGYILASAVGMYLFGLAEYVLPLFMLLSTLLCAISTFFKSNGFLFGAKDTESLMAMPIKNSEIISSKIISLYILEMVYVLVVMLPVFIVQLVLVKTSIIFVVSFLISIFFIPLIPMVIAMIIGSVIAYFSSRFKFSNIISIVLSLVFVVGIMVVSYAPALMNQGEGFDEEQIKELFGNISPYIANILSFYPPALLFKMGLEGNILATLGFIAVSAGLFFIFVNVLSSRYLRINTLILSKRAQGNFKFKELKSSSPLKALYKKELKRYFSSTVYVTNTIMGCLLLVIAAVALLVMQPDQIESMAEFDMRYVGKALPILSCMMIGMSATTHSSLSLEGKNMWILKSSPLEPKTIYLSKVLVNFTITIPVIIFSGILFIFSGYMSIYSAIFSFLTPLAFTAFTAYLGLVTNSKYLNLHWTAEVQVIKQGAPAFITIMCSMFPMMILMPVVAIMPDLVSNMFLLAFTLIMAALAFAFSQYMAKKPLVVD